MIRKFYEADHGYDNSGSSLTSGVKSAEEIKDNKIMLLEEDIWCVHKYFDDIKIPKSCKNGQQYSIVGRIKRLEERYLKQMSELESQYAHQQPVILKDRCEYEQLVEQYFGFKMTEKTREINTDDHILTDFACHVHQHLHQPVQGYSREQMDEYGKNILKSISDTFLNPENLKKASLNDQAVIQAVGEKILDFPLPEIEQPVNDGWVRDVVDILSQLTDYPKDDLDGWIEMGRPVTITIPADIFAKAISAINQAPTT